MFGTKQLMKFQLSVSDAYATRLSINCQVETVSTFACLNVIVSGTHG